MNGKINFGDDPKRETDPIKTIMKRPNYKVFYVFKYSREHKG